MKIEGEYTLKADRQTLWRLLNDRAVLEECIPGSNRLVETAPDQYETEMSVGIGMIRGSFSGKVRVTDKVEPSSYKMLMEGSGPGGWVKGAGLVSLAELPGDQTAVAVDGDVDVGGLLARVGQRMMGNASKTLMKQFFTNLEKKAREAR